MKYRQKHDEWAKSDTSEDDTDWVRRLLFFMTVMTVRENRLLFVFTLLTARPATETYTALDY